MLDVEGSALSNPRYTFSSPRTNLDRLQYQRPSFWYLARHCAHSKFDRRRLFRLHSLVYRRTSAGYQLRGFFTERPDALEVGSCETGIIDAIGLFVTVEADGFTGEVFSDPILIRSGCPLEEALAQHTHVTLFDLQFPGARDADVIVEDRTRPISTEFMPPTSRVKVELDEPYGGIIRIALEAVGDAVLTSSRWLTTAPISADLRRASASFTHMFLFDAGAAADESFGDDTVDEFTFNVGSKKVASFGIALGEEDTVAPTGSVSAPAITSPVAQHFFNVTYRDESGIDLASLGDNDLRITDPSGAPLNAEFVEVSSATAGAITVRYAVNGPGGSWDSTDPQGTYVIRSQTNGVLDNAGLALPTGNLGNFRVDIPPPVIADSSSPTASASVSDIISALTRHSFTVTYRDDRELNSASIGNGDVVVRSPTGTQLNASFVEIVSSNATSATARYSVAGPGGQWDADDTQGTYTVRSQANQVSDTSGNSLPAAAIGTFRVAIPPPTPVDNIPPTAVVAASPIDSVRDQHYVCSHVPRREWNRFQINRR